jgi:hypothetical protein
MVHLSQRLPVWTEIFARSTDMYANKRGFAGWVALSCVIPLAALFAVVFFGTPVTPTALAALLALLFISPRLLSAAAGPKGPDDKHGVGQL